MNGRFVAIELKVDTNPMDPMQTYKARLIRESNGMFYLATPNNWRAVIRQLQDAAD